MTESDMELAKEGLELPVKHEDESNIEYLRRLEKTGKYLFHGSPYRGVEALEPRQAKDLKGDEWGNDEAVYAVPAVIAVGRAILPKRESITGTWKIDSSRDPENSVISVTDNISLSEGSVYVVSREGFVSNEEENEWKIKANVKVLAEVIVSPEDYKALGGKIEIVNKVNK